MFRKPRKQIADRLPPASEEAERGTLGCIFLSPNECMDECIDKLKPLSFYSLPNRAIYECLVEMYEQKQAIDIITVQQRLKDKQLLEQVGGLAYLSQLPDAVPSAANLSFYVNIVREKYLLRTIIQTCTEAIAKV